MIQGASVGGDNTTSMIFLVEQRAPEVALAHTEQSGRSTGVDLSSTKVCRYLLREVVMLARKTYGNVPA
jgi:hypothetical protein